MSTIEHHGLIVPSSPEDRKRLKGGLEEVVNCLAQIKAQQEHKKDIINRLYEEFDVPKKLLNKVSRAMFNEEYQKVAAEAEDFETLVETLKLGSSLPVNQMPSE